MIAILQNLCLEILRAANLVLILQLISFHNETVYLLFFVFVIIAAFELSFTWHFFWVTLVWAVSPRESRCRFCRPCNIVKALNSSGTRDIWYWRWHIHPVINFHGETYYCCTGCLMSVQWHLRLRETSLSWNLVDKLTMEPHFRYGPRSPWERAILLIYCRNIVFLWITESTWKLHWINSCHR